MGHFGCWYQDSYSCQYNSCSQTMSDTINFNVYQQSDHYQYNTFFKNILLSFYLLPSTTILLQKKKKRGREYPIEFYWPLSLIIQNLRDWCWMTEFLSSHQLFYLNIPRDHFSPIPSISALFHSSFVFQAFLLSSLSKLSTGFVFSHFIFTSSLLLLSCFFLTWIYSFITNSGPKSWGSIMV